MKVGNLALFVVAPPRWKGDGPRTPDGLLGKMALVLDGPYESNHDWGGLWSLFVDGKHIWYWGDFLDVINESR